MRKTNLIFLLVLIPAFALANTVLQPSVPVPLTTGTETVDAPVTFPPYMIPAMDGTDLVGDTVTIGTTWYEGQHNGTIGRMVEKSDDGYLHFVWMNGTNSGASDRHVYYNTIDPSGTQGWYMAGYAVESSARAGYTTLDVDHGGIAFPAFHQQQANPNFHTAVGTDFFPHAGAFLIYEPPWIYENSVDLQAIWPRIMFDSDQVMRIVATHSHGVAAAPQRQWYISGEYDPLTYEITFDAEWDLVGWTNDIAADVATSDVSDRVAFAWTYSMDPGFPDTTGGATYSQWNNDIYVLIDDDGQDLHFDDYFNLTQFIPADPAWLPDTLMANMDTLRAYTDLNVFIDQDDWVHVSFTTRSYLELEGGSSYWHPSIVWHWSEQFPSEFQVVCNAFDDWDWNYTSCGAWQVKAQRPSLGQDPSTGYLYCMYHYYDTDTTAFSLGGFPSGEVFISMSQDGGESWSEGINITGTVTPNNASPGQCWSELSPSMAKLVDGTCHIMYVVDRDAGFVVQTEGTWTFNEVKYHSVPVDLIPASPLVPQDVPLHVSHGTWPGIPGEDSRANPVEFGLSQNYPNPFNPVTSITFALDEVSTISLKVFNLLGEEVAEVTSGNYGSGEHTVTFDGSNLASGVYLYKLEAGSRVETRKMLLLK